MPMKKPATIAEYIDSAPKEGQKKLREMYAILKKAAPRATESIKWGLPVFEDSRILFAFSASKSHLSVIVTPSAMKAFTKEATKYKTRKGSIQFPYDEPLPKVLIGKIAALRVKELREKDVRWK